VGASLVYSSRQFENVTQSKGVVMTVTATMEAAAGIGTIVNEMPVQATTSTEIEELFQTLVRQWRADTAHLSLVLKKVTHPAYQRIIGLGPVVIPLILREWQRQPGHWHWALQALTGEDPTQSGDTVSQTAQAWLQWGKEKHFI
jgi:hypothetical protein